MVVSRTCSARRDDGEPCRAAPLRDGRYCLMHDPAQADVVAEARRLGGSRRRKEATVAGAYDIEGLGTVAEIRRIVEIVLSDGLSMENSIARGRLLLAAAQIAAKLLEVGELERRLEDVEAAVRTRPTLVKGKRR